MVFSYLGLTGRLRAERINNYVWQEEKSFCLFGKENKMVTFNEWVRDVINTQAVSGGNAVSLDDFTPDGNHEYYYPKRFVVAGDEYWWEISRRHTPGRHLCSHYEIWFHGVAFGGSMKVDTGVLTKGKIRKGLKRIYEHYREGGYFK